MDWLTSKQRELAAKHRVSLTQLVRFRQRVIDGGTDSPIAGTIEPARISTPQTSPRQIPRVGAVILAGGMATRFGGVVKALFPVLGAATFMDLKLAQIEQLAAELGQRIPVYVMASHATEQALREALRDRATVFVQNASFRFNGAGDVAFDDERSLHATGHGDFGEAFVASGLHRSFLEEGGEWLFVSNVDNLAATLAPMLATHIAACGASLAFEVCAKRPGDAGGAPAQVDGQLQIVEGFRFPRSFDGNSLPHFNTNTFWMRAAALRGDERLDYFAVRKDVDGCSVVQFERLVGQLSAHHETVAVEVPRDGAEGRFLPIKRPADLESASTTIKSRFAGLLSS